MRERPPVTVPEGGQIHAGGETAKRVPRMAKHHVEGVHVRDADMGQQVALITPVNLRLRTRDDLEAAVQTRQRIVVGLLQRGGDPRPGLGKEQLDLLIVAGEAVLGDQPLMDHGPFQGQIGSQPRLDPLPQTALDRLDARSRR